MDFVDRVNDFELSPLVNRFETPLFRSFTGSSYASGHFEKVTRLPWHTDLEVCANRDIMYSAGSIAALSNLLSDNYAKDPNYFFELAELLNHFMDELKKTAVVIRQKTSENELAQRFDVYAESCLNAWPFLIIMPVGDKVITDLAMKRLLEKVPDKQKAEEYFRICALPEKENEPNKEEKAFLKLCVLAKNNGASLEKQIVKHVAEFGWFASRNLWGTPWNSEDVKKRMADFLASGVDPRLQLEKLKQSRKEIEQKRKEIRKELGIKQGSELDALLKTASEYAFLRTYRTDCMHWYGFQAKPLLNAIAKRFEISYTELVMMSVQEIKQCLKQNVLVVPQKELQQRRKEFGTILVDGEFHVVSGDELERLKKIVESKLKVETATEVRGNSAFHGKVVGTAKIVMSHLDLKKVQPGDVMVAVMTFPDYAPAMERAAAFVTDEGGVLCHAAIVSREMQKPCVIATKTATKTFKDGDKIEVDAVSGKVRKV